MLLVWHQSRRCLVWGGTGDLTVRRDCYGIRTLRDRRANTTEIPAGSSANVETGGRSALRRSSTPRSMRSKARSSAAEFLAAQLQAVRAREVNAQIRALRACGCDIRRGKVNARSQLLERVRANRLTFFDCCPGRQTQ